MKRETIKKKAAARKQLPRDEERGKRRLVAVGLVLLLVFLLGLWWRSWRRAGRDGEMELTSAQKTELEAMGVNYGDWLPDAVAEDETHTLEMKLGN